MANDITAPHLWKLDTAEAVKAAGKTVRVGHVSFVPAVNSDDLVLQEYDASGTAKDAIIMKGNGSNLNPVDRSFLPGGIELNGLVVGTIDGGVVNVFVLGCNPA